MLIEVGAPDEQAMYDEALDWSDPDRGLITIIAPAIVRRPSDLLRPAIAAIGGVPLTRPASGEAQSNENAIARLRAHGLQTLILLESRWVPPRILNAFAALVTLAGIDLIALSHPNDVSSPLAGARTGLWGLAELRRWLESNEPTWQRAAGDERRHQRLLLPRLGLARPRVLQARPSSDPVARRAYADVRRSLGVAPPLRRVATVVRHALDGARNDARAMASDGASAALAEIGYALLEGDSPEVTQASTWRDLRRIPDTTTAAVVTLFALGLDDRSSARLRGTDVEPRASIHTRRGAIVVPPAAGPFLDAQLTVRSCRDAPFLVSGTHPLSLLELRRRAIEGISQLGLTLDDRALDAGLPPSQRWLLERGFLVTRTVAADSPRLPEERSEPAFRRCRHFLPGWLPLAGGGLTHSQMLCRAAEPDEVRPAAGGYRVMLVDRTDGVERFAILQNGQPAGSAWRVESALGIVWVQTMAPEPPALETVAEVVWATQHRL